MFDGQGAEITTTTNAAYQQPYYAPVENYDLYQPYEDVYSAQQRQGQPMVYQYYDEYGYLYNYPETPQQQGQIPNQKMEQGQIPRQNMLQNHLDYQQPNHQN